MHRVCAAISVAVLVAMSGGAAAGEDATVANPFPVPPCAGNPSPGYPGVSNTPIVRIWRDDELKGWHTPACIGFTPFNSNTLMATSGRFRAASMDEIAGRLARISSLLSVRYYAGRDENWKNLYTKAHALADVPQPNEAALRRPDFTQSDIQSGHALRFWQEENSALKGIAYRLTIVERTNDRLVYAIVNETPAKALFFTASEPGEFRQFYAIERDRADVWRYYSLVEARIGAGPISPSTRSFRSRAIAYYRHIAGYPTEMAYRTDP
jgi:hypothetical protein